MQLPITKGGLGLTPLTEGLVTSALVLGAAFGYLELSLEQTRSIIRDVARITATWRNVAKASSARGGEINQMYSAFEHTELRRALRL